MHRSLAAAVALDWALAWALVWSTSLDLAAQQFQFAVAAPRPVTSLLPQLSAFQGFVAVDDFDSDGHNDVVATFANTAGIFPGSPTGPTPPLFQVTWNGQRPVPIDLDGDGDRDLAFLPPLVSMPRPILLYQNTPLGMLPVPLPAPLGGPGAIPVPGVALGDIDADGFVDLVIAVPAGSVTPSIVLARGGPGLQFTLDLVSTPAGLAMPLWPALVDADGDGDLDVLATNTNTHLRLLRNTGGTFADATATLPTTHAGLTFLAAADLDGDGRGDCATVFSTGDIDVLWGGPGGFAFAHAVATVSNAKSLLPADFDGDGDRDLLVDGQSGLDVLWNQGNRQFARVNVARREPALRGVGDVDRDGMDDIVFAEWDDPTLVRCKYRGRIEDTALVVGVPPPPLMAAVRGLSMAGDADGDGRTDLVTAGVLATVFDRALGGGVYAQTTSPITLSANTLDVRSELADMDGDGDLDLVVKTDVQLAVALNNGAGVFAAALQVPSTVRGTSWGIPNDDLRVGDMDGDGDRDIVIADQRGAMLVRNLGSGQFAAAVVVVAPTPSPRCVEIADVDGDGDRDVICDAVASSGLTHAIVANDGTGTFAPRAGFYVNLGIEPTSVRAADLDGDGDADLVVADSDLRVYRNDGSGFFADRTPFDVPGNLGPIITNVAIADVDDDGDLDIAALRSSATPVLLLLNDGSGRMSDRSVARIEPLSLFATGMLRAADVDDDGDVDLTLAGAGERVLLRNHLRQCRAGAPPRLGGVAAFDLVSGPGFGQPGLAALGVAAAVAAPPVHLPGLVGQFDLDGATLQVLALVPTSPIGVSTVFLPVPQQPALFGAALWFQGAVLPASDPPGFTNAIHEVVLR